MVLVNPLPRHVAVVPDGNRRWARKRGWPGWRGHLKAAKPIEEVAQEAVELGVQYLTVWGGSYANLTKRSRKEISVLNRFYKELAEKLLRSNFVHQKKVKVKFVGEWPKLLNKSVIEAIKKIEEATSSYNSYRYTCLVGYNGDREMLDAISRLLKDGYSRATPSLLKSYLWTADLPPVDLVIRTGGEPHLSTGFMMWHTRDAQLYFSDKMWPDFGKADFVAAVKDYSQRERRFGR